MYFIKGLCVFLSIPDTWQPQSNSSGNLNFEVKWHPETKMPEYKIYEIKNILINFTILREDVKRSTCKPVIYAQVFTSGLIVRKGIWNLNIVCKCQKCHNNNRYFLPVPQQQQDFVFQHPFTANVSGPTCWGKTYFVKMLLQHCKTKVYPPPERILWLYKRWQPLYDIITSTVCPPVEFVQGIPLDLEQASFISSGTRNLVNLHDLMSTAAKYSRISELFTEGSHQRNLSVASINQNLYYNKDPTKDEIVTIFSCLITLWTDGKSWLWLDWCILRIPIICWDILKKPHLSLTDISLSTWSLPRTNTCACAFAPIKSNKTGYISHYFKDAPKSQTYLTPYLTDPLWTFSEKKVARCLAVRGISYQLHIFSEQTETAMPSGDMPSCDYCGLLFENMHDLHRHVKRWCPESFPLKRKRDDENDEDQLPFEKILITPEEKNTRNTKSSTILCKEPKKTMKNNRNFNTTNISKEIYPEKKLELKRRKWNENTLKVYRKSMD